MLQEKLVVCVHICPLPRVHVGVLQAQRDREELEKQVSCNMKLIQEATEKQRQEIRNFISQTSQEAGQILTGNVGGAFGSELFTTLFQRNWLH